MTSKRKLSKLIILAIIILVIAGGIVFYFAIRPAAQKPGAKSTESREKPADEMILIPAGEFIMGSSEKEIGEFFELCRVSEGDACRLEDFRVEYPRQITYWPDFYIDKKEVSNKDYEEFAKATGSVLSPFFTDKNLGGPNYPVVGVSWFDALEYCQWRGKRLPWEAEWEKAARGEQGFVWSWGDEWDGKKLNHGKGGEPGYDDSDGYLYLAPVNAELGVSPYGVLNMSGNAAEWVTDDFAPYPENSRFTHKNYKKEYKVFRGGTYVFTAADLRGASRLADDPLTVNELIGFRCAKDK